MRLTPIIVNAEQRTDEWFKARLGIVTGSRVKDTIIDVSQSSINFAIRKLLGVKAITEKVMQSDEYQKYATMDVFELFDLAELDIPETEKRKNYRWNLVGERLTNMQADPDPYVTNDMKWGIVNEQIAKTVYQMQERVLVEEAPLMLHPTLKCGASPDGLATDMKTGEIGLVEIKCLRTANHLFKIIDTQEVPEEFYDQIQMQLWISGRDWCDFIGFDSRLPDGLKIFVKRVAYNDDYINTTLEPNVRRFLDECSSAERYFRMKIREQDD